MKITFPLIRIAFIVLISTQINAQVKAPQLTLQEQQIVVDSISSKLTANYIFPDVAEKMASSIKSKLQKGDYKSILDPDQFANTLTADLRAISKDKHIWLSFGPEHITKQLNATAKDSSAHLNWQISNMKRNNFGFKEVKILDGNVGYLDLRSFYNVEHAGKTAVSAMNFLSNSDAIIIDLRSNYGGHPTMIQLITSYLYGSKPVHLNNFYWRPTDSNSQTWTLPHVSGTRSPDTPVYILTSSHTFSAGEEFCYNLKNLKRATLIGETTGGGAHPGREFIATNRYMIWIPTGRAINPITNTNWEGTGVSPHIETPAKDAFNDAYLKALETLMNNNKEAGSKAFYEWAIAKLKVKTNPINLDSKTLKSFVGSYGARKITIKDGTLFYQADNETKYELYPYSDHEFMLKGLKGFRIRFLYEGKKVTSLQGLYGGGGMDISIKENK
ncbi:S41 family peptidase [Flavivirga aquimarina]|uniref:S41 family peptidase n=1 Tax=Flavivirga aquimarina TaxID=2027862 RepID=A0ABT8WEG9_9FLAO|nr:S41 family peptidase [Flavivirga aquimarina]MDO5971397.1 S41 family peptidase [Flavivirga aquimarina]